MDAGQIVVPVRGIVKNVRATNSYLGVLPGAARSLGAFVVRTRRDEWRVGMINGYALELGVGYGR